MSESLDSAGERFGREQVCRILRLDERQLAAWERQGLLQPSRIPQDDPHPPAEQAAANGPGHAAGQTCSDCYYTFSDIVTLKTLIKLRQSGVPPARIRLAHTALRQMLAEVEKPWSELQIKGSGKNVIVQFQGARLEPVTGQFLLEYAPAANEGDRIRPFKRVGRRKNYTSEEKKAVAERFFLAGLRYEETGGPSDKAIRAYQKAIEINPDAVGAYINLGTIYYNLGQLEAAESCYQSALSIDPGYGLVHFNLGNVADEKNDWQTARQFYEEAIRRDPAYPDPHYNLALVYEKLGFHGKARQQWLRYLKHDRQSQWASYARLQLEKTPLRIIRRELPAENTS